MANFQFIFAFFIFFIDSNYCIDYTCNPCHDFGNCQPQNLLPNPYYSPSYPQYGGPNYCKSCTCPTGYSGQCCDTYKNPCSPNPCDSKHTCHSYNNLTHSCDCPTGKSGTNCEITDDPCANALCRPGSNCTANALATIGYTCACDSQYSGTYCEVDSKQSPIAKCSASFCSNGGICFESKPMTRSCVCQPLTSGPTCGTLHPCYSSATNPCQHGGRCVVTGSSTYKCDCLNIWMNTNCQDFNICNNVTNPCVYGTCSPTGSGTYKCTCIPGYTGKNCQTEIDNCSPNPCQFNGTCYTDVNYYNCTCIPGTTGYNCQINIDDCGTQVIKGQTITYCSTVDPNAVCNDLINGYSCTCSADYTDANCTMSMIVWLTLKAIGTGDMNQADLIKLLEDMVKKPSLIKDMIPFMLALMPEENQTKMGYDYDEMFVWASYERTELKKYETKQWYETTLGNCFTFNADDYANYTTRYSGLFGGYRAMLRVRTDEYLSWIDTEGLSVFVHDPQVAIFGESVRYTASPGGVTTISLKKTAYQRLNGRYGDCVTDKSAVGSYYYDGAYTTDGCLRGCYQDKVQKSCECMDPRYPRAPNATICPLTMRNCVLNVSTVLGDPSKWPDCRCPLPCTEVQYEINYSLAGLSFVECQNLPNANKTEKCLDWYNDIVYLEVYFPSVSQRMLAETPKMTFMAFISNVGGLLGVFTGVSIISFIEFAFLFYRLFQACCDSSGKHIAMQN